MAKILRFFAYLFQLAVSLCLLALTVVVFASDTHTLQLPMFPWSGMSLSWWLLGLSIAGLSITVLAIIGWFRFLFVLWSLYILWVAIYWIFISPHARFGGRESFIQVLAIAAGALIAFLASLTGFRNKKR